MSEHLFQWALSNAVLALVLAGIAVLVGRRGKRPHLTHGLWILVFVKLLTPPLLNIPLIELPGNPSASHGTPTADVALESETAWVEPPTPLSNTFIDMLEPAGTDVAPVFSPERPATESDPATWSFSWSPIRLWILLCWFAGSAIIFSRSMLRAIRFDALLRKHVESAPNVVHEEMRQLAKMLGLKRLPQVAVTQASLSPMVWWTGGHVRVIIPQVVIERLERTQWRLILAHELAHVRRKDFLIRWIEWAGCVLFWWNPLVWWAQRKLRESEEICCDALVVSGVSPQPQAYAFSLLNAVESLTAPVYRPPAMASEINSGGFLERRFEMILSNDFGKSGSTAIRVCVLAGMVFLLPFGLVVAQDYEAVEERLERAVKAGELDGDQAKAMLGTLKRMSAKNAKKKAAQSKTEFLEKKKAMGKRRALAIVEGIKAAVAEGDLSEEQAELKLMELKLAWSEKDDDADSEEKEDEADGKSLKWVVEQIKSAVKEGDLSEEEAERKLLEIRLQRLRTDHEAESRAIEGELRLREYTERIKAAVEEGDLSEEQAERKMIELRQAWSDKNEEEEDEEDAEDQEDEEREQRMAIVVERIKAAVERGDVSEDEAEEKIIALRSRWMSAAKEAVEEAEVDRRNAIIEMERIKRAVVEGDLSKEDAQRELIELRVRLAEGGEARWVQDVERKAVEREIEEEEIEVREVEEQEVEQERRKRNRFQERKRQGIQQQQRSQIQQLKQAMELIVAATQAGELSKEDASAKVRELRKRLQELEKSDADANEFIEVDPVWHTNERIIGEALGSPIRIWTLEAEKPESNQFVEGEEVVNEFVELEHIRWLDRRLEESDRGTTARLWVEKEEVEQEVEVASERRGGRLVQLMEKIKSAVERGELSEDDAARQLIELGKRWSDDDDTIRPTSQSRTDRR